MISTLKLYFYKNVQSIFQGQIEFMKLLTWNCNLNLSKKFHILEPYNCDIFIIQECERLKKNFFPNYDYFWSGKNEKKGLGILVTKSLKERIINLNNQI